MNSDLIMFFATSFMLFVVILAFYRMTLRMHQQKCTEEFSKNRLSFREKVDEVGGSEKVVMEIKRLQPLVFYGFYIWVAVLIFLQILIL